jgi:helix-turn-helix protein
MRMVDIDRLLTVPEAAKFSSVLSEGEVRARIDDGRIKATVIGGRIFVLIDHLENYLEARGRRLARLDQTK